MNKTGHNMKPYWITGSVLLLAVLLFFGAVHLYHIRIGEKYSVDVSHRRDYVAEGFEPEDVFTQRFVVEKELTIQDVRLRFHRLEDAGPEGTLFVRIRSTDTDARLCSAEIRLDQIGQSGQYRIPVAETVLQPGNYVLSLHAAPDVSGSAVYLCTGASSGEAGAAAAQGCAWKNDSVPYRPLLFSLGCVSRTSHALALILPVFLVLLAVVWGTMFLWRKFRSPLMITGVLSGAAMVFMAVIICFTAAGHSTERLRPSFTYIQIGIVLLLCIAVIALACAAVKIRKERLGVIFFVLCLCMGLIYWFTITPLSTFDEQTHIRNTLYHVSRIAEPAGSSSAAPDPEQFYMRQEYIPDNIKGWHAGVPRYEENRKLFRFDADRTAELYCVPDFKLIRPAYMYAPQVLGGSLMYLLGANRITFYFGCAFANLLFYASVCALAVQMLPRGKKVLMLIALLPIAVKGAASFSYDGFVNALSFLLIALIFRAKDRTGLTFKNVLPVIAVLVVLSPCKVVYGLLGLLFFLIPKENFKRKHARNFYAVLLLAAAAAALLLIHLLNFVSLASADSSAGISPFNGQPSYVYMDVFAQPFEVFMLFVRTLLWESGAIFMKIFGRIQYIEYPLVLSAALLSGITAQSLHSRQTELHHTVSKSDLLIMGAVVSLVSLALCAGSIAWTPRTDFILRGLQGRYFLPVVPLMFFMLGKTSWKISEKARDIWFALFFTANLTGIWVAYDKFILGVYDSVRSW